MKSFLSAVAKHILEIESHELEDCSFVFPNRRAVLVFKNEIIKQAVKPIWSPEMNSIDDWLSEISGFVEAKKINQVLDLYFSFKKITGQDESLDNFFRWAEILIKDFDDIDKYLVDTEKIFKSVRSVREIEIQFPSMEPEEVERLNKFWSSFHPSPSSFQKSWLRLWQSLGDIYFDFNQKLNAQGLANSGQIYRMAMEKISSDPGTVLTKSKYFFIGFNALTKVEEKIFEIAKNEGKAGFYWDIPDNILEEQNESGRFLRPNLKRFPPYGSFGRDGIEMRGRFSEKSKTSVEPVNIYACDTSSGQVGILRKLIKQSLEKDLHQPGGQRAVILADERLLEPVLSAIAFPGVDINISMGFPVVRSLIADFILRIIQLNLALNPKSQGRLFVNTRDLIRLIRHPVIRYGIGRNDKDRRDEIEKWPSGTVPLDWVLSMAPWFNKFIAPESTSGLFEILNRFLKDISDAEVMGPALENESYRKISDWLGSISYELKSRGLKLGFDTLERLYTDFVNKERLPFEGSLQSKIQLTGILETRLMDYDELFVLSCNEGIWPAESSPASLIPYSLRKAYSLPTREFSDSFYGYYFYRLLNRAVKVHLMYANSPDPSKMSQGEPSRFIQQLRYDTGQARNEYVLASRVDPGNRGERSIPKAGIVLEKLLAYLDPGQRRTLSPSALNTYIDCPLRFAYQYVLGIREEDDFAEAGEPRMFGILLHKTLENLYAEFESSGRICSRDFLRNALKDKAGLNTQVIRSFMTEYFKNIAGEESAELFGKDLLVKDVLQKQIASVLMVDSDYAPFQVLALEKWSEGVFYFTLSGEEAPVKIGGYIDRIDKKGDVVRILDYKSGNPDMRFRDISELFDSSRKKRPKEILQALVYCFIYKPSTPSELVRPAIYPSGRMRGKTFDAGIVMDGSIVEDVKSLREEFDNSLRKVLAELFDVNIGFYQTSNEDNCSYCPFKDHCSR